MLCCKKSPSIRGVRIGRTLRERPLSSDLGPTTVGLCFKALRQISSVPDDESHAVAICEDCPRGCQVPVWPKAYAMLVLDPLATNEVGRLGL